MASELIVQTIQGPSSGANANKVLIPSGHTLDVSGGTLVPSAGQLVNVTRWTSPNFNGSTSSTSYITMDTLSLTAKVGNLIYVTGDFPTRGGGSGWYLTLFRWNDASDGVVWNSGYQGVNGTEGITSQTLSFSYTWSGAATHDVSMQVRAYNSTRYYGTGNQDTPTTTPVITIMEFKQ